MPLAKGSMPWIIIPITLGIITIAPYFLVNLIYLLLLAIIWFLLAGFFVIFFRDPDRQPPPEPKYIVAPADGKIMAIEKVKNSKYKISTFMNVYNVHVNRVPIDGKIIKVTHKMGGFKPAFDKDSDQNERVIITMQTKLGTVEIIQIAGILARRIMPYVEKNQKVVRGERLGIIRFGSRVDLILPAARVRVKVRPGECVHAGTSIMAKIG